MKSLSMKFQLRNLSLPSRFCKLQFILVFFVAPSSSHFLFTSRFSVRLAGIVGRHKKLVLGGILICKLSQLLKDLLICCSQFTFTSLHTTCSANSIASITWLKELACSNRLYFQVFCIYSIMCYKVSKSQQKVFFINHLFLFLWQATPLRSAPLRSPPKLYFSNERGTTTLLRQRSNFNLRVEMMSQFNNRGSFQCQPCSNLRRAYLSVQSPNYHCRR